MTRFDAEPWPRDPNDATVQSARSTIAGQFAVFTGSIVLAALAIVVACGLMLASEGARYHLARAVDTIELSVFLQPQVSRADAEGLRARLDATPTVTGAKLRTRDDAMAALVAAGLPTLSTKPNPLPDVWVVTLAQAGPAATIRSLATRVADARTTLSGLPGVESVRVDGRWVELLDRWTPPVVRGANLATWLVTGTLAIALFCVFFVAGRAYRPDLSFQAAPAAGAKQALATVGMTSGLLSLALAGAALALGGVAFPDFATVWKPIVDSVGRNGHVFVVSVGVAAILVAAAATTLGGSRR